MGNRKTPIQSRALETNQKILNESFLSFFKNGFKKTNTILIAKKLNISVGIIYAYYKNKEELFLLWLNNLLTRLDTYLYNQFKLRDYGVDLSEIFMNILEKCQQSFFCSIVTKENIDFVIKNLSIFYSKCEQIFIKTCFETNIVFKDEKNKAHIIFNLIKSYSDEINLNQNLKESYAKSIISILSN